MILLVLVLSACSAAPAEVTTTDVPTSTTTTAAPSVAADPGYGEAPQVPGGPLDPAIDNEVGSVVGSIAAGGFDNEAVDAIASGGDPRVAWFLADLLRFFQAGPDASQVEAAFTTLTGVTLETAGHPAFVDAFNHLIAWDLPAWDGYERRKGELYTLIEPGWQVFFDENVSIDWRWVTWGGVLIDDRPLGDDQPCPRGCIPSLDDPPTVPAERASWLEADDVVFGISHNGAAVALPRNQMEVHEMVNLELGGDRLGIPYCTLCGSAQAYLTAEVPPGFSPVVLRTSGLLSRSNKVMYDLVSGSVFDTFTGEARSGPLGRAGVVLPQITVVTSTWGDWVQDHPDSEVLAEDGGIGREYDDDPLGGRDARGPIFPIGPVDPRLPVQAGVVGVTTGDGMALAFPVAAAEQALEDGSPVSLAGFSLEQDGDGFRVSGPYGEVPAHESFWFAWSQFHPDTLLWGPDE